jgi:hypothetical protein
VQTIEQLRCGWEAANARVQVAEAQMASAWARFAAGGGPPPSRALIEELTRQSVEADRLLAALFEAFNEALTRSSEELIRNSR